MSDNTVEEICLFVRYSQLFLEEKELNLLDVIGDLSQKMLGKRVDNVKNKKEKMPVDINSLSCTNETGSVQSHVTETPVNKDNTENTVQDMDASVIFHSDQTLVKQEIKQDPSQGKMVKVICMEGLQPNCNPKVKKMGPYFKAMVLGEEEGYLKLQVREEGFDPYVFSLPKEDVELIN